MAWQGIPFKLITSESVDTLKIALQTVPKILIDNPPDYTAPLLTGLISLLAGLIPAGIAVWTFKRNASNLRNEREAQQQFLKDERAKQHEFMKEERATQIASTEKDRETQLAISKQNFDMQVLSVNRQQWINNLRDVLADYISIAPDLIEAKFAFLTMSDQYSNALKKKQTMLVGTTNQTIQNDYDKATVDFRYSLDTLRKLRTKEKLLIAKIKMMLNPKEEWHSQLSLIFLQVSKAYNSLDKAEPKEFANRSMEVGSAIDSMILISQDLLKFEWERVKKGI